MAKKVQLLMLFLCFLCQTARGLKQKINEHVDHWPILSYFLFSWASIDAVYEVFCLYKILLIQCVQNNACTLNDSALALNLLWAWLGEAWYGKNVSFQE